MVRDVRVSFFISRPCVDLADLNCQAALWNATVANTRGRATTGEVPAVRLAHESLLPLTGRPLYDTRVVLPRRVSSACLVASAGHHDSVPYRYDGRQVYLRVYAEQARLEIWAKETCLAIPPRLLGHGRQSLHPDHLNGLGHLTRQGKGQRPLPASSPPPVSEEATSQLHLPGLSAMPEVEVRHLTVYTASAAAVSA